MQKSLLLVIRVVSFGFCLGDDEYNLAVTTKSFSKPHNQEHQKKHIKIQRYAHARNESWTNALSFGIQSHT